MNKPRRAPLSEKERTRDSRRNGERRSTIRRNRKLPKGCVAICSSWYPRKPLSAIFFLSPPSPRFFFPRYLLPRGTYKGLRPRRGLLSRPDAFPTVAPRWKTMLRGGTKNRQKFCNCQAWYFAFVHACIYSETLGLVSAAYFTTDSR